MKNLDKVNTWSPDGRSGNLICYFAEAKKAAELDADELQSEHAELLAALKSLLEVAEYEFDFQRSEWARYPYSGDMLARDRGLIARLERFAISEGKKP